MRKGRVLAAALLSGIIVGAFFMYSAHSPRKGVISLPVGGPATIYQWRDKDGNLYMSSEKPPAGVDFQTLTVDGSLSRMDAPRPPESPEAAPGTSLDPLKAYTPSGAKQLVRDAQNAAQAVRDHQQQLHEKIDHAQ